MGGDVPPLHAGRTGGVRLRSHPQPDRRRVDARRGAGRAPHARRRDRDRGPRRASTTTRRRPPWMPPCASTTRGRSVDLDERKERVARAVAAMREHRDLLALLLVWEIGKPWRLACADVDRALDGVDWYLAEADRQLAGRRPLAGPVSNIASWNYPMSVQVHAELVQVLAGNAVIAKTPEPGRLPLPDPRPRADGPRGPAGDPRLRARRIAGRRAHPRRRHRLPRLRRRPRQRPQGRDDARRHRPPALPRAGGPERLGDLGVHAVGPARRAHQEGLRVRQAALHRLPPVRRAARHVRGVPADVPARRGEPEVRPPARGGAPRRSVPGAGLRAGDQRGQGLRPALGVRPGRALRRHPAGPPPASTRAGSSTGRTPRPTSPRPASCSRRPPGTCTTRSRSARSTRSSSWTPSRSSSPR